MLHGVLSLTVTLLASAAPDELPAQEERNRTVWMPSPRESVDVFLDARLYSTHIELPDEVELMEKSRGVHVLIDEDLPRRIRVGLRRGKRVDTAPQVNLTLVAGSTLRLRLVTRPHIKDGLLRIRKKPLPTAEDEALRNQEFLSSQRSMKDIIDDKARRIADVGAAQVFARATGDGFTHRQAHGLTLTFEDVYHDAGLSFATLAAGNDSESDWVLDADKIVLRSLETGDVPILTRVVQHAVVPPKQISRIVLVYQTPSCPRLAVFFEGLGLIVEVLP